PARAHEMNVIGTLNLLAGCAGAGSPVRRFVLKSSGHVYGSRFDLPTGLREDHRLDTNSRHQFVRDIVEVESYVSDFAVRNPNITILALRFSNSLNPDEPQPLARYLDLEVVPTVIGYDPPIQLIHRDDCIDAMVLATKRGPGGAYNIAPPGNEPDRHAYQYEKELEDFIHSRQLASANGEGEVNGLLAETSGEPKPRRHHRPRQAPHRSRS